MPTPPTPTTTKTLNDGGEGGSSSGGSTSSSTSELIPPHHTHTHHSSQVPITISSSLSDQPTTLTLWVTNVVCSFSTRCHLPLRKIALAGLHVEFKKENNMLSMKLRKPSATASMWQSGKCTCTGSQSEPDAYKAARRFCRILQKMGYKVKLSNYRVVNVLATCAMPFQLDVVRLAESYPVECSYEPELHPGATFKIHNLRATLKLFSTGSITLTAPSVDAALRAIQSIHPILERFKYATTTTTTPIASNPSLLDSVDSNKPATATLTTLKLTNTNQQITTSPTSRTAENLDANTTQASSTTLPPTQQPIGLQGEPRLGVGEPTMAASIDHFNGHYPSMVHYDPWSSLHHHNTHNNHNNHAHNHHHNHHLHHHHLHHLNHHTHMDAVDATLIPPPPQPAPSNHWFGHDNLLIDNVLDDFLQ